MAHNTGGFKYWVNGLPIRYISNPTSTSTPNTIKYWMNGLPVGFIVDLGGKIRAFFFGQ